MSNWFPLLSLGVAATASCALAQDPPTKLQLNSQSATIHTKIGLGKSGRVMQLFDLASLRPKSDVAGASMRDGEAAALAGFFRQFLDPAPGEQDDVQVVGGRWLLVLGKQSLLDAAERLVAANIARRESAIDVEVRITKVANKLFEQVLRPHLVAVEDVAGQPEGPELRIPEPESGGLFERGRSKASTRWQGLLGAKAATGVVEVLLKDGSEHVAMPRLAVSPMQLATVSNHNQTAYVRDFEIEQAGDKTIASPVVDVVSEGIDGRVLVMFEPDGRIGVDCEVSVIELLRPIPVVEVDLGVKGAPKGKVQLPRTRGVRLRQVAHLAAGEVAVVAAPRAEGGYLVAMIAVRAGN